MRVGFLVPYVPNLIRTRPYNLILALAALGHEVEVFTLGSGARDRADAAALRAKCHAVHYRELAVWQSLRNSALALPSRRPLQSVYSWQEGLAKELMEHAAGREYDILHVEHLRGSRYGTFVRQARAPLPIVWDSVDCISHLFRQAAGQSGSLFGRVITRLELGRTAREEGRLLSVFDQVLVTSPTDRAALLELVPRGVQPSPVAVLSNGVDLEYFHPNLEECREPAALVFSGKMSYHANISMARHLVAEIMPRVWAQRPEACLYVVGKDPPAEVRSLGLDPRIRVTGTVDDIRPYLWRATVAVVPLLYGAGIQNKILEAMATGTPVVTSPQALAALRVTQGEHLMVADSPARFADAILNLLRDDNSRRCIGDAGAAYVRRNHDWTAIASQLTDIYHCTVERWHASASSVVPQ